MPYKANEKRRHKIPKARYRVKNWRDYDAALRRRGDLTVWVTAEAIEAWTPAYTGRRGRPQRYSEMVVETGLMLRLAFARPWRQTEGMLASILRLLGLDLPVPDHTTFSRRSVDLTVAKAVRTATGPVNVVIDSTGLKVFGTGEWQRDRHLRMIQERGRLGWQKAVNYGRRSLGEIAMMRYKTLIGRRLHARTLPTQKAEAAAGCKVLNVMTRLGKPVSQRIT